MNIEPEKELSRITSLLTESLDNVVEIPFIEIKMPVGAFWALWHDLISNIIRNNNRNFFLLFVNQNMHLESYLYQYHSEESDEMEEKISPRLLKIELPTNIIQDLQTKTPEQQLKILQKWNRQESNISIKNIISINVDFIKKWAEHLEKANPKSCFEKIGCFIDFVTVNFIKNVQIFPKIQLEVFFSSLQKQYSQGSFQHFFKYLEDILPKSRLTLTITNNANYISYFLEKTKNSVIVNNCDIPLQIFKESDKIKRNHSLLENLEKNYSSKHNYLFQFSMIFDLLNEIINTALPISISRLKYLLQKTVYHYTRMGQSWEIMPKPLVYNPGIRFLAYMLGYRLNLRKISYWSIFEQLHSIFRMNLGDRPKILLIHGESRDLLQLCQSQENSTAHSSEIRFLLLDQNSEDHVTFTSIQPDKIREYLGDSSILNILDLIKTLFLKFNLNAENEFITNITWIGKPLLRNLIQNFILDLHSHGVGLRKISDTLNSFHNDDFLMWPENPVYLQLKNESPKSFLHKIAPILTDLHEY